MAAARWLGASAELQDCIILALDATGQPDGGT